MSRGRTPYDVMKPPRNGRGAPAYANPGNTLYYDQRTGNIIHNGQVISHAKSGRGKAMNNPDYQYKRNTGPIPQGTYRIERPRAHSRPGVGWGADLVPVNQAQMKGRDEFVIHYGRLRSGEQGSLGCIVPESRRELTALLDYIGRNGITSLKVYDSAKWQPGNMMAQAASPARQPHAQQAPVRRPAITARPALALPAMPAPNHRFSYADKIHAPQRPAIRPFPQAAQPYHAAKPVIVAMAARKPVSYGSSPRTTFSALP